MRLCLFSLFKWSSMIFASKNAEKKHVKEEETHDWNHTAVESCIRWVCHSRLIVARYLSFLWMLSYLWFPDLCINQFVLVTGRLWMYSAWIKMDRFFLSFVNISLIHCYGSVRCVLDFWVCGENSIVSHASESSTAAFSRVTIRF